MPPSASDRPGPDRTRGVIRPERQALLAAVADPVRLSVLALLREPRSVTEVCQRLDMAQPRISHHLAVLRRCGLVVARAEGRRRLHRWDENSPSSDVRRIQELLRHWLEETPAPAPARVSAPASTDFEDYLL